MSGRCYVFWQIHKNICECVCVFVTHRTNQERLRRVIEGDHHDDRLVDFNVAQLSKEIQQSRYLSYQNSFSDCLTVHIVKKYEVLRAHSLTLSCHSSNIYCAHYSNAYILFPTHRYHLTKMTHLKFLTLNDESY